MNFVRAKEIFRAVTDFFKSYFCQNNLTGEQIDEQHNFLYDIISS